MSEAKYVIYQCDDWDVLYVNGKLKYAADTYQINDYLREQLGVVVRSGDGNTPWVGREELSRENVAKTLQEVEDFENGIVQINHEAEALRIKADELMRAADRLEGKA